MGQVELCCDRRETAKEAPRDPSEFLSSLEEFYDPFSYMRSKVIVDP